MRFYDRSSCKIARSARNKATAFLLGLYAFDGLELDEGAPLFRMPTIPFDCTQVVKTDRLQVDRLVSHAVTTFPPSGVGSGQARPAAPQPDWDVGEDGALPASRRLHQGHAGLLLSLARRNCVTGRIPHALPGPPEARRPQSWSSSSVNNSCGVHISGGSYPPALHTASIRILNATLARCLQFHVSRYCIPCTASE
jgi:hypothetical protein